MPGRAVDRRDLGGGGLGVRIMGLAVLLLLFLSAFGIWALRSNLRGGKVEARSAVLRNTRVATALGSSVASTAISELVAISTLPGIVDGDEAAVRSYISTTSPVQFFFTDLLWATPDGITRAATSDPDGGTNLSDREYFRAALAGQRYVSAGLRGRSSGNLILVFAVPTHGRDGNVNGVLGGTVDLSIIDATILRQLFGTDTVSVYGRDGKLVFGADRDRLGTDMPAALTRALRRRDEGLLPSGERGPSGRRGQVVSYGSVPTAGWTVVIETDADALFRSVEDQYHRSVLFLAVLGAAAFVVAAFGAWRLDAAHRRVVEASARLAAMIEQLPAGVVLVDGGGHISMANTTALEAVEAISGRPVEMGEMAPAEVVASLADSADGPASEINVERAGLRRSFSVRSTPVRTRRGSSGSVALVEETTTRRAEERRRTAMVDLVAALAVAESTPQIGRTLASRAPFAIGCDRCALLMLDGEGDRFDIASDGLDADWRAVLRPDDGDDSSPLFRAMQGGRAVEVTHAGGRSLVLPLQSAGRVVGAVALDVADPARELDPASIAGFAAQVALAVDRTRRREIEHDVSLTLQRTLLAASPAESDQLSVAVRYRPSSDQMLVGGDFFDVINRGDGTTLLVIGDVVGHGLEAATTMAQVKIAIRAFAQESASPAVILGRLDEFVTTQLESARYTTAVLALVDPASGTLRYAVAGHPPPLCGRPDGTVDRMATRGEPLLGLPPRGGRTEIEVELEPGATTVCLYTDGLIERPDLPLDEGIARLADAIEAGDPTDLDLTAERIMELVDDAPQRDDVALLYAVVRA